jgi:hypothetical protein
MEAEAPIILTLFLLDSILEVFLSPLPSGEFILQKTSDSYHSQERSREPVQHFRSTVCWALTRMDNQIANKPQGLEDEAFELGPITPDNRSVVSVPSPGQTTPVLHSTANTSRVLIAEIDDVRLNESALPPVDRGRYAWSCLVGAFIFEGISLGMHL